MYVRLVSLVDGPCGSELVGLSVTISLSGAYLCPQLVIVFPWAALVSDVKALGRDNPVYAVRFNPSLYLNYKSK